MGFCWRRRYQRRRRWQRWKIPPGPTVLFYLIVGDSGAHTFTQWWNTIAITKHYTLLDFFHRLHRSIEQRHHQPQHPALGTGAISYTIPARLTGNEPADSNNAKRIHIICHCSSTMYSYNENNPGVSISQHRQPPPTTHCMEKPSSFVNSSFNITSWIIK